LTLKFVGPGGAFFGLDAVLIANLHQELARVQQSGELAAQSAGALGKVLDEQVGQRVNRGADTDFGITNQWC
jgi:hypothetical protein